MLADQVGQRAEDRCGVAHAEFGGGPGQRRVEILVPQGLAQSRRPLAGEPGQDLAVPTGHGLAEQADAFAGGVVGLAGLVDQRPEPVQVDLVRGEVQDVAAAAAPQGHRWPSRWGQLFKQPTEPGDQDVEGAASAVGGVVPDPVDEGFDRDRPPGVNGEGRKHEPLLRWPGPVGLVAAANLDRAEQLNLHGLPVRLASGSSISGGSEAMQILDQWLSVCRRSPGLISQPSRAASLARRPSASRASRSVKMASARRQACRACGRSPTTRWASPRWSRTIAT